MQIIWMLVYKGKTGVNSDSKNMAWATGKMELPFTEKDMSAGRPDWWSSEIKSSVSEISNLRNLLQIQMENWYE